MTNFSIVIIFKMTSLADYTRYTSNNIYFHASRMTRTSNFEIVSHSAGILYDVTSSFATSFSILAAVSSLTALSVAVETIWGRLRNREENKKN